MMRIVKFAPAFAGLLLALTSLAASATPSVYDFSYSFGPGEDITGSFTADALGGGMVGDITGVSAFVNGVAFNGPLTAYAHTNINCSTCYAAGAATASVDFYQNNFFFSDGSQNSSDPSNPQTNWFYIIPWPDFRGVGVQYFQTPNIYFNYVNYDQVFPESWSLTGADLAVPEPASWTLFAAALTLLAGFGFWRGKRTAAL